MSLVPRVATALGLAALLAGLLAAAEMFGERARDASTEVGRQRAEGIAAATEQFVVRALGEASALQLLAERWVELAQRPDGAAREEVERIIHRMLLDPRRSALNLSIFDVNGDQVWSAVPAQSRFSVADRPYFAQHAAGETTPIVSSPLVARGIGRLVIPVSFALRDAGGGFAGVAFVPLGIEQLSDALATLVDRPSDVAAVLRMEGDLLARSAEVERFIGRPLLSPATRQSLAMEHRDAIQVFSPVLGKEVLVAARRIPESGLVALASVELAAATAEARAVRVWARVAAVAAWVAIVLLLLRVQSFLRARTASREAAAVQSGRSQIERLLTGLPAILFLRDVAPDGRATHLYRAGDSEAVSGWPASVLPPDRAWAGLSDPDADFRGLYLGALRDGNSTLAWRMRQPNGGWAWMRTTLRLLERRADGGGLVVGYIVNITAERDADARVLASARLASLGEMGAGLAHELKQPLTAISLAAEVADLALQGGDVRKAQERLRRIVGEVQRGAQIIEYLRRFARGADADAPPSAILLRDVLDGALTLVGGLLRGDSIQVETSCEEPDVAVLGHLVPLQQVIVNLLLNARDVLLERGGDAPRVIRLRHEAGEPGMVRILVSDTGGGIPPWVFDRLFEPFVTTKGPDRGTGLGLAISHGLIRSMSGTISARNAGDGAEFVITLPRAPGTRADDPAAA